jgi:RNA ligase
METPVIKTIADVLPHIEGDNGIYVTRFDDYDVIDYGYVAEDTFDRPMRLECRGLKFAKDGQLLARRFHKFFNIGERQRPEEIDWSQPHVVLDKLDGSMVHSCLLNGELVFMTRMGATAQAQLAASNMDENALRLSREMIASGMTAMFEFTSPDNRIVIAYDKPAITLLAIRETESGRYLTHSELSAVAARFDVPLVGVVAAAGSMKEFVNGARELEDIEGYVIAFDDGHRLKLKTGYYALRHKALSGIAFEKNILAWVAEGAIDDVVPLLAPDIAAGVLAYQSAIGDGLNRNYRIVGDFVSSHSGLERRDYALAVKEKLDKRLQPVAFSMLDGKDGREMLKQLLVWAPHSDTRVDTIRDLYNMSWDSRGLEIELG